MGDTVDVENATRTKTIGTPELIAASKDPEVAPALKAFSDGRVLEIPTPCWTAYDAPTIPTGCPLTSGTGR